MSRDGKFGTFGGVFTPSLLTILGVIMYLRLPWVVGSAGLYQALGIIVVAHVISVSTGLSISSIATDKAVGAGGPYYIISRSLGLPIGGALGLALFVGLAFSISLYIIGFSESLLTYFGLGASVQNIRLCGTLALIVLTIITFISTALAIKTQYVILALIALSLLSIFLGSGAPSSETPHLFAPQSGGSPLNLVFGIFFPAVTGFTAGVNMSGDLRSPKRSIPTGTLLAIGAGFIVYVLLAIFLAFRVPAEQLRSDPELLINIAWSGPAVVAGIWAATLSSALGSILGSPRILQAVSADAITPKFFAKGYGPTHEPRNALLLSCAIGEAGILIGELDIIARVVSMIFLTMYCVLNLSCAVESWASPDFRPDFRIPKTISIVGAVTCLVVMIQLDPASMAGALALMAGLFLYLSRKQLQLESGDAWEGIWASMVRAGLHRLTTSTRQARHWKPNVLAFGGGDPKGLARTELIEAMAGSAGILTHVALATGAAPRVQAPAPAARDKAQPGDAPPAAGIFHRELSAGLDPDGAIREFCSHYGFTGIEPNTVLLRWSEYVARPDALAGLLRDLGALDFNQLVLAEGGQPQREQPQRIDVWWRDQGGNLPFSSALSRFITTAPRWEGARVRFVLLSDNASNNDVLRARARRYLKGMRLEAEVAVISNTLNVKGYEEWVRDESSDADLVLVPLPDVPSEGDAHFLTRLARVLPEMRDLLLLRASSSFEEVLAPGKSATDSLLPAPADGEQAFRMPPLTLPGPAAAREFTSELAGRYEAALSSFDAHCVARVHSQNIELVRRLKGALERHFAALEKGLLGANARRRRQAINRFLSSTVIDAQALIDAHLREGLSDQQATLEGRIEAFLDAESRLVEAPRARLVIERDRADLAPAAGDPPHLRRLKRRMRLRAFLRRGAPRYAVRTGPLTRYYFERVKGEILQPSLAQLVAESHQLAVHLGKLLSSSSAGIAAIVAEAAELELEPATLANLRARAFEPLDEVIERAKSRVRRHRRDILARGHGLLEELAADLERLDADRAARKERKPPRGGDALRAALDELPKGFAAVQAQLYERAKVGLTLSAFHRRLTAIVSRQREAVGLQLRNGAQRVCEEAMSGLEALLTALEQGDAEALKPLKLSASEADRLDPKQLVDALSSEAAPALADLPESMQLLSDAAIDSLEEGRESSLETVELPLRSLGQFLVESELVAGIHEQIDRTPELEGRAIAVARDVTRLVAFQLAELKELGLSEDRERREHMTPGLKSALQRLSAEQQALRELATRIDERFEAQLSRVIAGSDPYHLTDAARMLGQYRRLRQGKMAVSGAQGLWRSVQAGLRRALVSLLYRGSAGVVLARKLQARQGDLASRVERLRALVRRSSPEPATLNAMPFYYRQVFFGQALNESFWVGRGEELARARLAAQSHRDGESGIMLVVGTPGSGKTALCQRIASKALGQRPAYWVQAPPGGGSDVVGFRQALWRAVGQADAGAATADGYDELLPALPRHAAIVVDDLELWWDRCEDGFAVIDELLSLVARHGDDVLFIFSINRHAFRLLSRLRPIADQALAVIECGPLPARELGMLLTLRHGSTGMKFALNGTQEEQLSSFQLARLFSRHFAYADGSIGGALRSWVTHVDKVRDGVLSVRAPARPDGDALDELRGPWRALLLQLVLHRRLSLARLRRLSRLSDVKLESDLDSLVRTGLVTRSRQGLFEINPFVHPLLLSHLEHRGLLSA